MVVVVVQVWSGLVWSAGLDEAEGRGWGLRECSVVGSVRKDLQCCSGVLVPGVLY